MPDELLLPLPDVPRLPEEVPPDEPEDVPEPPLPAEPPVVLPVPSELVLDALLPVVLEPEALVPELGVPVPVPPPAGTEEGLVRAPGRVTCPWFTLGAVLLPWGLAMGLVPLLLSGSDVRGCVMPGVCVPLIPMPGLVEVGRAVVPVEGVVLNPAA